MPRNVRNSWLRVNVDGRKSDVATGPRRAGGGMEVEMLIREGGCISPHKVTLEQFVDRDGLNIVRVAYDGVTQFMRAFER